MNKSFIISYREDTEDRKYNLKILLNWLSYMQDGNTEIIIVEQDSISKIDWLHTIKGKEFIKHIFIKNDGIFNLGWGYNVGVYNSNSEIIIINSVDILIRPLSVKNSMEHLLRYDIVKPYKSTITLDKIETERFIGNNFNLQSTLTNNMFVDELISSGCFIIKKSVYMMLKGFDEDCYGYGYEDNIIDEKFSKLGLKSFVINDSSVHLYHKNHVDNNDIYYSFTSINKLLFDEYKKMNKDCIIDKINSIKQWGSLTESTPTDVSIRHLKRELYEKVTSDILTLISSKFTDEYIKTLVDNISSSVYNTIIEEVKNKISNDLKDIKYDGNKDKSLLKRIMKKFKF